MKEFTPTLLVIAALLGACSTTPTTTSLLDKTRSDYLTAQGNPKVATYAPLEMKQAGEALNKANVAAANKEDAKDIDKLAYLAHQKIALTQEVAKQKSAEADVGNAAGERDKIRLEQRTNEANQAKQATQVAQDNAARARVQTQEAEARTALLQAQLADLAAKKTERGMIITFGDLLFGTDLARLNADGLRTAQKLANVLEQNPQRNVLVEGFADSTGSSAHNQELSERRATAVRGALEDVGVARSRIAIRGYGESYPVAANDSGANRQLNRRVEIVLSDENGKVMAR
jgi:outer membrane protein OmpA-like peptidoglycan-associated protein